jgi:uncharacterized protein YdhG (YjbR/CyaY superfamily)
MKARGANNVVTIEEYIQTFPPHTEKMLREMYRIIRRVLPKAATEAIKYGIPTFVHHGNLVHFGGYEKHVGFYPGSEAIRVFKDDLASYKTSKGTVQFPLSAPLPRTLIRRMVKHCVNARIHSALS